MVELDLGSIGLTLLFLIPLIIIGLFGYNFYVQSLPEPVKKEFIGEIRFTNNITIPYSIINTGYGNVKLMTSLRSEPEGLNVIFYGLENGTILESYEIRQFIFVFNVDIIADYILTIYGEPL